MIDFQNQKYYNAEEVKQLIQRAVNNALGNVAFLQPDLENCISGSEKALMEENNDMTRKKERIMTSTGIKWATGKSHADIEKKKRDLIEADLLGLEDQIPTFHDYADSFVRRYKDKKVSANTRIGYHSYLKNHLYPAFGALKITQITVNVIQDWMNDEADKGLSKKMIHNIKQLLTQILDSAVEDEIIPRNPCTSKKLFNPSTAKTIVLPYAPSVYKQFEEALPTIPSENDRLYAALSIYCGMRKGEILALRWEDIDLESGFIHIRRATQYAAKNVPTLKEPKTENGVRDIPILDQMLPFLDGAEKKSGFILHGRKQTDLDRPMSQQGARMMEERINRHFAEHGIKEVFLTHRMRHTVLTLLNNSGEADDKSLQAWAGHKDAAFTRRQYMASQEEQLSKVGKSFGHYLAAI